MLRRYPYAPLRLLMIAFCSLAAALCIAEALPARAQLKSPTEDQCRQMTEHMLAVMKSTLAQLEKESDRKAAQKLNERAEQIVRDGRARKAHECIIWSEFNKLIVNQ